MEFITELSVGTILMTIALFLLNLLWIYELYIQQELKHLKDERAIMLYCLIDYAKNYNISYDFDENGYLVGKTIYGYHTKRGE